MSNSNERANNKNDPYAPKWVRESPRLVEDPAPQRTEQPVPKRDPVDNQAHARVRDATSTREPQSGVRAQAPLARNEGAERSPIPRFLDPQFFKQPPAAPQRVKWVAAGGALVVAALLGAGVALLVGVKLSSQPDNTAALNTDTLPAAVLPKPAAEIAKIAERPSASASAEPRPVAHVAVAALRGTSERVASVHGVSDNEVRLGISAPFTGRPRSSAPR
jgi:hypothetical protein